MITLTTMTRVAGTWTALLFWCAAGCASDVGSGQEIPVDRPDAGGGSQPDPDAEPEARGAMSVTPVSFEIAVGETVELSAALQNGAADAAPISWVASNSGIVELTTGEGGDAEVLGVAEGRVTLVASSGTIKGTVAGEVISAGGGGGDDLPSASCCVPGEDNFCANPPGTEGCAMTQAGGYCDPDGDASYTDGDWERGYYEHQEVCGSSGGGGDLSACCAAAQDAADGEPDNICDAPPGTAGCAPTSGGGYCDPDGDASYTDGDWDQGFYDYQAVCR